MDESFPVVDVDASLNEIKSKLMEFPAVLIEDFKRITGIITRSDALDLTKWKGEKVKKYKQSEKVNLWKRKKEMLIKLN